jgi:hypothetical protein
MVHIFHTIFKIYFMKGRHYCCWNWYLSEPNFSATLYACFLSRLKLNPGRVKFVKWYYMVQIIMETETWTVIRLPDIIQEFLHYWFCIQPDVIYSIWGLRLNVLPPVVNRTNNSIPYWIKSVLNSSLKWKAMSNITIKE